MWMRHQRLKHSSSPRLSRPFHSPEAPTCTAVFTSVYSYLLYIVSASSSLCLPFLTYSVMEAGADRTSGRSKAQLGGPATTLMHSAGGTSNIASHGKSLTIIELLSDRTEISSASLCTIPFARNPHYAHRKSLEKEVQDRLSVPGARVTLVGLGGMGYVLIVDGGLLHG